MPAHAKNEVTSWSKDPVIRHLQKVWVQSRKPISAVIQDSGLGQSLVYKILRTGPSNADISTIHALGSAFGLVLSWGEVKIVPLELLPEERVQDDQG